MKASLFPWIVVAASGLAAGSPASTGTCHADNCARAVARASLGKADCSSFLESTILQEEPTVTTTITPTAPATTTSFIATVTQTKNVVSESLWPTTINTELSSNNNFRRAEFTCTPVSTLAPSDLPSYASSACSNPARYRSACSCAGVTSSLLPFQCFAMHSTVFATPTQTITQFATSTYTKVQFVTTTLTTPLVDKIRCNDVIQIDEDLPNYKIVCEAQGVANRTLIGTLSNTDWDNCVERATFGLGATDWEFDLDSRLCSIYDKFPAGNKNITTPRKNHVYAFVLD